MALLALPLRSVVAIASAVVTPNARAQILEERATVKFSGPVEIPGQVLPAESTFLRQWRMGT